jgi:hypothetical protein
LLTKGVHPKIVSEMLGHPSVSITLDVYSHVIPRSRGRGGVGDGRSIVLGSQERFVVGEVSTG